LDLVVVDLVGMAVGALAVAPLKLQPALSLLHLEPRFTLEEVAGRVPVDPAVQLFWMSQISQTPGV
jgi:hypothetical protein